MRKHFALLVALNVLFAACGGNPSMPTMPTTVKPEVNPPPVVPATGPETWVGAGDIGWTDPRNAELTARLVAGIPGTVFTAGDNSYCEFSKCYEPSWGSFKDRTYPTPGNHDFGQEYYSYFGSRAGPSGLGYYSYALGAWHVIALNSNLDAGTGSLQYQWLRADLQDHPAECIAAYWHHPVFSSGANNGKGVMAEVWKLLETYGADVVVAGHEHFYERFARADFRGQPDPKGIRQFVVGTGGASLYRFETRLATSEAGADRSWGVIRFILRSDGYDWQFLTAAGEPYSDSGTDTCR